ncbi:hypothetical protein KAI46_03480 [bacterium]|nr:hypothetical protein [bacterium]
MSIGFMLDVFENNIPNGAVTIIEADFSPNAIALFLALINHACILVPLTRSVESNKTELIETAQGEFSFTIDENDKVKSSCVFRGQIT